MKFLMFLKNSTRKKVIASDVKLCKTVLSRSKGLMFSPKKANRAVVLVFPNEQKVDLHMFFVFFPIDVIFLDKRKRVVEMKKNFEPFTTYVTHKKAKYAVEVSVGTITETKTRLGDQFAFYGVVKKGKSKVIGVSSAI